MDDRQSTIMRAAALQDSGHWDQAAELYEGLLRSQPDDATVLCHLGALELSRSRPAESLALLERAAELEPRLPAIHNQLGIAYKSLNRFGDASQAFEQALRIDGTFAAAYYHLAELAQSLGQLDAAVSLYRQAIGLAPEVFEPYLALGKLLFAHANWKGAEQCFRSALDTGRDILDRDSRLEILSGLGVALLRQERLDEAVDVFQNMLAESPRLAEIHSNLAFLHERQGRIDEALAAGHRAIELNPDLADAHNNLGVAFRSAHRLPEAEAAFARAVELQPEFALAHFNLGSVRLLRENYAQGWEGYEHRQALIGGPPRRFAAPRWDGSPLPGGALLLHAEQGFGDTIQFIRFARQARQRSGALIVAEVPAALAPLVERVEGIDAVVHAGHRLPEIAAEIPLPSLPGVLGIDGPQLGTERAYLAPDEGKVCDWRERLQRMSGSPTARKIGLAWQGNPSQSQDVVRSCPLRHFARLHGLEGIQWFSLQKEVRPPFEDESGLGLVPLGHLIYDFDDTAAILAALDLVITVDTSVAHLAGALGRPTWTLLCHTPDWRWQLDRSDSPWYPSMRLLRQPKWGDWGTVLDEVRSSLELGVDATGGLSASESV